MHKCCFCFCFKRKSTWTSA